VDKAEAAALLQEEIGELRKQSYKSLLDFLEPVTRVIEASSGLRYQLETQAFWDQEERGNLVVVASIDDFGAITRWLQYGTTP
jgi:hypothetical protein